MYFLGRHSRRDRRWQKSHISPTSSSSCLSHLFFACDATLSWHLTCDWWSKYAVLLSQKAWILQSDLINNSYLPTKKLKPYLCKNHSKCVNLCRSVSDVGQWEREKKVLASLCSQAHLMSCLRLIWPHGPFQRSPRAQQGQRGQQPL